MHSIGVDETVFLLATAVSAPRFVPGIVELTRGRLARLLDVVDGRFGPVLAGWLAARDPAWKRQVGFATLDLFCGYANALRTELGEATWVLDAFHTVLAAAAASRKRRCLAAGTTMTRSTASAACCAAAPNT